MPEAMAGSPDGCIPKTWRGLFFSFPRRNVRRFGSSVAYARRCWWRAPARAATRSGRAPVRPGGRRARAIGLLSGCRVSLERLTGQLEPDVVFGGGTALGPRFPAPWIGWIPDFQNRRAPWFFAQRDLVRRAKAEERLVRHATAVVVSSRDAHSDLVSWFPQTDGRAHVLSFATTMPGRSSFSSTRWFAIVPGVSSSRPSVPARARSFDRRSGLRGIRGGWPRAHGGNAHTLGARGRGHTV